jgi:hypothetical protein
MMAAAPAPVAAPPPVGAPAAGAFPQIIAYQGKGIQIRMDFAKAPNNASMTAINATVVTNQPSVTGFQMQAAVPKYIRMQMVRVPSWPPPLLWSFFYIHLVVSMLLPFPALLLLVWLWLVCLDDPFDGSCPRAGWGERYDYATKHHAGD